MQRVTLLCVLSALKSVLAGVLRHNWVLSLIGNNVSQPAVKADSTHATPVYNMSTQHCRLQY